MIKIPLTALALGCSTSLAILLPATASAQVVKSKPIERVPPVSIAPTPSPIPAPPPLPVRHSDEQWRAKQAERKAEHEAERARIEKAREERQARREAKKAAYDFTPDPAIWTISDSDTTIHFFGMIDHRNYRLKWMSERLQTLLASADAVYFPKPYVARKDRMKNNQIGRRAMHLIIRDDRPPFDQRVKPEYRDFVLSSREASLHMFGDFMPTWLTLAILSNAERQIFENHSRSRVERDLVEVASADGVGVQGLRPFDRAMEILTNVTEDQQRGWLNDYLAFAVKQPEEDQPHIRFAGSDTEPLTELEQREIAWAKGETADTPSEPIPGLSAMRAYLRQAQIAEWTIEVEKLMATPGTIFIALDIDHLTGKESLADQLAAKGYRWKRINP